MKNLFFLISFFLGATVFAQDVAPIQKTLITKRTATWCSNCGAWGWSLFEGLLEDNAEKAHFFAAHYSGDLTTSVAQDITANFTAIGQPRFYVNENDIGATSGNASAKRTEVQGLVDAAYDSSPVVGVGLEVFWDPDNEQVLVNTLTRFFENASGEFYTALYLVEDGVVNFQQSQGADAVHQKVLRASFSDSSFGELLSASEFGAGDEFPFQFTMDGIENPLVSNLDYEYVVVVWEKVGDLYTVANVNGTKDISELVVNQVTERTRESLNIYPVLFDEAVTVEFELEDAVEQGRLEVTDLTGRLVYGQDLGSLVSGYQKWDLDLSRLDQSGNYFLTIQLDGQRITQKLIRK